ncbi:PGAP1-like protein-domain-containing protein [Jimgerdemannia flammicorona]|uniref:GPI inositol-deacylase n=1 Tax=Jimgerdemannia flammicorona TaxID=994334 RepID=A0A433QFT5_9FUNG|nr:PGAP1-like protein-domain-containing protein [Jimgerdemannia flammicorona]
MVGTKDHNDSADGSSSSHLVSRSDDSDSLSDSPSSYPIQHKSSSNSAPNHSGTSMSQHSKRHPSSSPFSTSGTTKHQQQPTLLPPLKTVASSPATPASSPQLDDDDDPPSTPTSPTSPTDPMVPPTRRRQRRNRRTILPPSFTSSYLCNFLLLLVTVLSLGTLAMMCDSMFNYQRDCVGCNQSYMRPSFVKLFEFDSEMTRFAGKYALYLYREKMYDNSDQPTGVPVLFIPGHAGSYKQVRSIAAEAAILYYDQLAQEPGAWERGMRGLDFFTVDFNEEFSALHGHSLLEQAEYLNDAIVYILSLYPTTRRADSRSAKLPDPTSVIIIGHSMGGVVARTMFTMHNYQPGTINTIITMSTPHLLPPAPFDWKISRIYRDINDFWRRGYTTSGASAPSAPLSPSAPNVVAHNHPLSLSDVTLVSIAGGDLDGVVCSDTANVNSIVPPSHGFTVFTTGVPDVWVGSDHPAILWCNQLVKVVARSLLEVVDARQRGQTRPVEQRMAVFRLAFLSGLEERVEGGGEVATAPSDLVSLSNIAEINKVLVHTGHRLIHKPAPEPQVHLLPIPRNTKSNTLHLDTFSLLTDQPIGRAQSFDVLLCTTPSNKPEPRPPNSPTGAWELPRPAAAKLSCRSVSDLVATVPASTVDDRFPFGGHTFKFLRLREWECKGYNYVAIVDRGSAGGTDGFIIGEHYNEDESTTVVDISLPALFLTGLRLRTLTPRPTLLSALQIPAVHNQFIAYKLVVLRPLCSVKDSHFAPFVRQVTPSSPAMYESKFHVNVKEIDVSFHGRVPFMERRSGEDAWEKKGLMLQFWADPSCPGPLEVAMKVDLHLPALWSGPLSRPPQNPPAYPPAHGFRLHCELQPGRRPHWQPRPLLLVAPSLPLRPLPRRRSHVVDFPCRRRSTARLCGRVYQHKGTCRCQANYEAARIGDAAVTTARDHNVGPIPVGRHIHPVPVRVRGRFPGAHRLVCAHRREGDDDGEESPKVHMAPAQLGPLPLHAVHSCAPVHASALYPPCARGLDPKPVCAVVRAFLIRPQLHAKILTDPHTHATYIFTSRKLRFTTNLILYSIIAYALLYGVRYTHSLYFLSNGFVTWLVILHARESWVAKAIAVYAFEHLFRFQNKKRS